MASRASLDSVTESPTKHSPHPLPLHLVTPGWHGNLTCHGTCGSWGCHFPSRCLGQNSAVALNSLSHSPHMVHQQSPQPHLTIWLLLTTTPLHSITIFSPVLASSPADLLCSPGLRSILTHQQSACLYPLSVQNSPTAPTTNPAFKVKSTGLWPTMTQLP